MNIFQKVDSLDGQIESFGWRQREDRDYGFMIRATFPKESVVPSIIVTTGGVKWHQLMDDVTENAFAAVHKAAWEDFEHYIDEHIAKNRKEKGDAWKSY